MLSHHLLFSIRFVTCVVASTAAVSAYAQAQDFKDVPPDHIVYEAAKYLKEKGIMTGNPDGTFRPGDKVTRYQAVVTIMRSVSTPEQLSQFSSTPYKEAVPAWAVGALAAAQKLALVDGPPKTEVFRGNDGVTKAEFWKILSSARRLETKHIADIAKPLAPDATNPADWTYPIVRSMIAYSVDQITPSGTFEMGRQLTRGDVALYMHRLDMYFAGRRTQALLSEMEAENANVLTALEQNDITLAEYASLRALIAGRGAAASPRGKEPIVQGALKVTESNRALVRAYRAGIDRDYDLTIKLAGEAWTLAAAAEKMHKDLGNIAKQFQDIAKTMADNARALKAGKIPEAAAEGAVTSPK